ncbi:MAG: hypothetical protein J6V11_04810, partial [Alphaproteobacteria bacterium]|nr:hypothetical protein [Alphaproteobacteria bacterium]
MKYILTFLLNAVIGFGLYHIPTMRHFLFPQPVIHVFLEAYATNPALSHMIEYAQLPKTDRKLIAWHRFPNRKETLDLTTYNTREVDLPAKEGMYSNGTRQMLSAVLEEASNNPEAVFELHTNFAHIPIVLKPFLEALSKEKIKRIHLYEDGYGELFKWTQSFCKNENLYATDLAQQTQTALSDNTVQWQAWHSFGLRYHYPVTYHFWGADELDTVPHLKKLSETLKDADIRSINFDILRKKLSNTQKEIIYRLSGFDYQKYKKLMRGKRTFMFVLGYHFGKKERLDAEEHLLKSLHNGTSKYLKNPKSYIWFYKPHPSYSAATGLEQIRAAFPDMIEVPAQVPFEVFILAGLKPTLTAGFSSSLFYSLHSSDVLVYVRRPGDKYQPFLTDSKRLKPEQVITYRTFLKK